MGKSLAQFLTDLAYKAGIKDDSPAFIELMGKKELTSLTLDDELVAELEGNLHTLDSAKSRLKKQFFAEAFNGADKEMESIMEELGFDDSLKGKLKGEHSTTKRIGLLVREVAALEAQKHGAKGGDKSELQGKINELNQKISDLTKVKESEISQIRSQYEDQITGLHMTNALSGYNYALGDIPTEVKLQTAQTIISKAMQAEGVRVINNNGQLQLVNSDGTDYFDKTNNKKDFRSFAEQVLAQNKLLKTSDQATGNIPTQQVISGSPQTPKSVQAFLSHLDKEIEKESARTAV